MDGRTNGQIDGWIRIDGYGLIDTDRWIRIDGYG